MDRDADGGPSGDAALDAAAHAFVAVGAMTAEVAQAIVDDYDLAYAYPFLPGRGAGRGRVGADGRGPRSGSGRPGHDQRPPVA